MNLDEAIKFASIAHKGATRKGGNQPYIFHPLEVLNIVSTMTLDEDVLAAAILHDTVEDTDVTIEDVVDRFGENVGKLVQIESEDKKSDRPKANTWIERKKEAIEKIKNCNNIDALMVCMADKISNLRSIHLGLLKEGELFWNNFNQKNPLQHYWHYNELKKAFEPLKEYAAYKEYCFLIDTIFDKYKGEKDE